MQCTENEGWMGYIYSLMHVISPFLLTRFLHLQQVTIYFLVQ